MAEATYPSGEEVREDAQAASTASKRLGDFKRFASTSFTRARQFTMEKMGKADSVTEYDVEFEGLSEQVDRIKAATTQILSYVESIVQPNPGLRLEGIVYNRLDRPKPHHSNPHEMFSAELARTGNVFGPETQYGSYMLRCAEVELKLGQSGGRFQEKAYAEFITPLKTFLEIDMKAVMRERRILNVKRLDLDACRTRVKKTQVEAKLQAAESELRMTQADYDIQLEKLRASMKKIVDTHVNHLGHLRTFMAAQKSFFSECLSHISDLEGAPLRSFGSQFSGEASDEADLEQSRRPLKGTFTVNGVEYDREESRKARVLYDYEAENDGELSALADQLITVTPVLDDEDYLMAESSGQFGKVPSSYVEFL